MTGKRDPRRSLEALVWLRKLRESEEAGRLASAEHRSAGEERRFGRLHARREELARRIAPPLSAERGAPLERAALEERASLARLAWREGRARGEVSRLRAEVGSARERLAFAVAARRAAERLRDGKRAEGRERSNGRDDPAET